MNNPLIPLEKPTTAHALLALRDFKEPALWVPGIGAVLALALLGQNLLFCALAVGLTLFLNRLWLRLSGGSKT